MALGPFLDFVIEFREGAGELRRSTIRGLGLMLDGDDVVFFNQRPNEALIGARIAADRIERISTDANAKAMREGFPPWESPTD